jgi:hypothetical protein
MGGHEATVRLAIDQSVIIEPRDHQGVVLTAGELDGWRKFPLPENHGRLPETPKRLAYLLWRLVHFGLGQSGGKPETLRR